MSRRVHIAGAAVLAALVASAGASAADKGRAPALAAEPAKSAMEPAVRVFDEKTSFEQMVLKKAEAQRDPAAFEPAARVIGVRRELGLSAAEAASIPQDIVLNAGTDGGLSEGMTLSVIRRIPMLDPYHDNQETDLEVKFATLKILHVQKDIAIARVENFEDVHNAAGVSTRAVLVGDYVGRVQ